MLQQTTFKAFALAGFFVAMRMRGTAKLPAQAPTVTGESQNISKNVTPSQQYIYFKIKESSQLIIRNFKKGE